MKISEVVAWGSTSSKAEEMNQLIGNERFVMVPENFPDGVNVLTTKEGHFVRFGEIEVRVWPEATPELAQSSWEENQDDWEEEWRPFFGKEVVIKF